MHDSKYKKLINERVYETLTKLDRQAILCNVI